MDEDGAVEGWRSGVGRGRCKGGLRAEEEVATHAGAGVAGRKVRCVTVDVQGHVTGVVSNDGIRVCTAIVEEMGDSIHGGLGAVGLSGREGAEGDEEGVVDGSGVEEEGADDLLEEVNASGW